MKKAFLSLSLNLCLSLVISAQTAFSVGTGLSGLRNFSPQQKFWAAGQTVNVNLHFAPKEGAYASIDYYTEGKFKNTFIATANSPLTSPQTKAYIATGRLTYRQLSLGWKHYFKGSYNAGKDFTIYGIAGFGYLFTKVRNSNSIAIDATQYLVRPAAGAGKLDRLTFDLGFGAELPLGGNFFAFADGRTWLPASGTESPYLHYQRNVPLPVIVSAGLRLLFDFSY
jgi:hypothetical protein